MTLELDHILIFTGFGAPVVDRIVDAGFTEGTPNDHPGQGTANRRVFFASDIADELLVAVVPFGRRPDDEPLDRRQSAYHPIDPRSIGGVHIAGPWPHPRSASLAAVATLPGVTVEVAPDCHATISLDPGSASQFLDLRPRAPRLAGLVTARPPDAGRWSADQPPGSIRAPSWISRPRSSALRQVSTTRPSTIRWMNVAVNTWRTPRREPPPVRAPVGSRWLTATEGWARVSQQLCRSSGV